MANAISTAGIEVRYAVETTAGTRPTSGYTQIKGVKVIPAFGDTVNTLQSTPLEALVNHTYIEGLRDSGGSISLTVNDYPEFRVAWDACVDAAEALTGGKEMWFEVYIPGMTISGTQTSFYFPGKPVALGFGGAEVDSVFENTANIIPTGDYAWEAAST